MRCGARVAKVACHEAAVSRRRRVHTPRKNGAELGGEWTGEGQLALCTRPLSQHHLARLKASTHQLVPPTASPRLSLSLSRPFPFLYSPLGFSPLSIYVYLRGSRNLFVALWFLLIARSVRPRSFYSRYFVDIFFCFTFFFYEGFCAFSGIGRGETKMMLLCDRCYDLLYAIFKLHL